MYLELRFTKIDREGYYIYRKRHRYKHFIRNFVCMHVTGHLLQ
jgi:hypothetical protein